MHFINEFSDYRVKTFLQRKLEQACVKEELSRNDLKNLRLCGSGVVHAPNWSPSAFVVSNGKSSRFSMITLCNNPWACPECSMRVMARKAEDIACAIDALAKWHNQFAIMFTFTLPHTDSMSCKETFTLLQNTWHSFARGGQITKKTYITKTNFNRKNRNGEEVNLVAGEKRFYAHHTSIWSTFKDTFKIQHHVKVYEFTWGADNGWHPHIHALFWFPKELINSDKILSFEKQLSDYWFQVSKREYLKLLNKRVNGEASVEQKRKNKSWVDFLFSKRDKEHNPIYISKRKNKAGKFEVIIAESSSYIAGWSTDSEVAKSHFKSARNGHFSPFQMLHMAYSFQNTNPDLSNQYFNLFIEYALATRKKRRCDFSCHSGIVSIIREWKNSESYIATMKKKDTLPDGDTRAKWHVVAYFTKEQWSQIYYLDVENKNIDLRTTILKLARLPDGRELIIDFLLHFDIDIRPNFNVWGYEKMIKIAEDLLYYNKSA